MTDMKAVMSNGPGLVGDNMVQDMGEGFMLTLQRPLARAGGQQGPMPPYQVRAP